MSYLGLCIEISIKEDETRNMMCTTIRKKIILGDCWYIYLVPECIYIFFKDCKASRINQPFYFIRGMGNML